MTTTVPASTGYDLPGVSIRNIRVEDLELLVPLDTEAFGSLAYPPFVLRQLFDVNSKCWFVAEDTEDGRLLGYSLVGPTLDKDVGWLLALAVLRAARGRGIGRRLVERSLDVLRAAGVQTAKLCVAPDNHHAITLYKAVGFHLEGLVENYLGPGEDRLLMQLSL